MAELAMKEEAHHMRAFGLELMCRVLGDEASAASGRKWLYLPQFL